MKHGFTSNYFSPQLKRRHTIYDIRNTNSAKRAGTLDQIPKILKKFSDSLTLYFTISYIFSVFSETSVANVFFDQTRSFAPLWRDCFFPWHWLPASENTAKPVPSLEVEGMAVPLA